MISVLGFKARVEPSFACFIACVQWIQYNLLFGVVHPLATLIHQGNLILYFSCIVQVGCDLWRSVRRITSDRNHHYGCVLLSVQEGTSGLLQILRRWMLEKVWNKKVSPDEKI